MRAVFESLKDRLRNQDKTRKRMQTEVQVVLTHPTLVVGSLLHSLMCKANLRNRSSQLATQSSVLDHLQAKFPG